MNKYKISFCTVSMNRLDHLKMTFIKNVYDNLDYRNIEFVLLNYNSNDDMDAWVRDNLSDLIEKGIVQYYHTEEPNFFHRSHSRNMAFKLAEGDIICNVDADNFIGKGFADYINLHFNNKKDIFIAPPKGSHLTTIRNVQGRICLKKEDFYKIKGFDERIMDYGY
jgi:cellulose synthase/poly-beta-1,6-N-acetylglucosamine synthase-like glycosyltransferase